MTDVLLDPITHDLDLTRRAGSLSLTSGAESVLQRIKIRFMFFLGEWFLDSRQGFPWFEEVFVKGTSDSRLAFIFRRLLQTTPGVESIIDFRLYNASAAQRTATLRFKVRLTSGEILDSGDPYIIDLEQVS